MRASQFLISTLKETPTDAEVISHQLMLRSGMMRKLASGLYTWLPIGLRTLHKVTHVIREEMNKSGALEVLMPAVQPSELWKESGRWQDYGAELLRIHDRHNREFCLGPTHEEVITDLIRREINSYKQLPANFYQIQMKFRDEIRPRYGIMRAREFIMKDAYSFHVDQASLQTTYDVMHETYSNIFSRIGLNFRAVLADSGSIGGSRSHEFHVLASSGEDDIAFSDSSDYAANIEMAEAVAPQSELPPPSQIMEIIDTPDQQSIEEVASFLKVASKQIIKTLIVKGASEENPFIALVLRGDHTLNDIKTTKLPEVASPLVFANEDEINHTIGCSPGSIGPIDLPIPVIVDHSAAYLSDFVCGANQDGKHYQGVNWQRDITIEKTADIRNVVVGDPSPDGQGNLHIKSGIEVGHIFQLGTKYSEAMNATVLNEQGKSQIMTMGCYGIGVSRIVAAAVEQHNDSSGIMWPAAIAPFQVVIIPINQHKSEQVKTISEDLYNQLRKTNVDVLLDDRNERPGVKFAEMDLIGIPHRIVISDRGIEAGNVEYKQRSSESNEDIKLDHIVEMLVSHLHIQD